jgi:hypothetical protein
VLIFCTQAGRAITPSLGVDVVACDTRILRR